MTISADKLKDIASTGGLYAADPHGNVWRVRGYRTPRPRKLKPCPGTGGYLYVSISVNNKAKRIGMHRLVAEAFHGAPPPKHDACHLNHDRTDNRPENLEWGPRKYNCQMSRAAYGSWRKGVKPATTKLKEHEYIEIVARYAAGACQTDIAAEYGVTQGLVSRIIRTRFPSS